MRSSFAILALAAGALARPQAVTSEIAPTATAPAGCSSSHAGTFEITVVNATTSKKRSLAERSALVLSLSGGVLTDAAGRTGYIASNYQFQFDDPPQAGAIYTAGFSVCGNDSLALGGSTVFYQCNSGDFYNLYDRSWAAQCSPVYLVALGGTAATVTQASDGQPAATTGLAVTQITDGQPQVVTQISDGQIQQPTGIPVSQISDGQPQGPTGVAVSQISDGQIQATSAAAVVSQISDGQIQATSAAVVSQISDGQIQATSAAPVVSQISDGQIQATSAAAVVTQISDGQIQATTAAVVVSQISDGQIQATSAASVVSEATDGQIIATSAPSTLATTAVVSQISDGQIQAVATNGTTVATATATLAQFTGAAATPVLGLGAMAAGVFGVIAML